MTEETAPKKTRRKRRTKAQIEAEKAPQPVVEPAKEAVSSEEPVKEEPVASAPAPVSKKPAEEYIPKTGINKFRNKLAQRRLKDQLNKK